MRDLLLLVGRIALAAIFVSSGFSKLMGWPDVTGAIASKGLPMPEVLGALTILVELGAGLLIVVGLMTQPAALLLLGFTLMATFFFHNFWDMEGAERATQQIQFMKNLAIMGGLAVLAAAGPGLIAIGRRHRV